MKLLEVRLAEIFCALVDLGTQEQMEECCRHLAQADLEAIRIDLSEILAHELLLGVLEDSQMTDRALEITANLSQIAFYYDAVRAVVGELDRRRSLIETVGGPVQ